VNDFGPNPTKIEMYIYVPDKLASNPPIILALHTCMGTSQAYYGMTKGYIQPADCKGFIIIYPQTTHDNKCWDVGTPQSLKHEGGGDTQGLAQMIRYTLENTKVILGRSL